MQRLTNPITNLAAERANTDVADSAAKKIARHCRRLSGYYERRV